MLLDCTNFLKSLIYLAIILFPIPVDPVFMLDFQISSQHNKNMENIMSVEMTVSMSDLFKALEIYEKASFEYDVEHFINSEILVEDEKFNWIPISAAIKKTDTGVKIYVNSGEMIHCAKKHKLIVDGKTVSKFAENIAVGDVIVDSHGIDHVVTYIEGSSDIEFYDVMVDSPMHLYQSANGFVHHNTEIAKQLAHIIKVPFVRFDMSEFQERHSVSKFIGSPPGYVGYSDGAAGSGVLINELEKNPHCVILCDEIEKAHPDIVSIFLQVMDNGMISSQNGKTASARNAFLIFTSNLGAVEMEKSGIGFGNSERIDTGQEAVKQWFAPEFRNRLDATIQFGRLGKESMNKVLDKFISQLNTLSQQKNISIVFDASAKQWLIDRGFDRNMGARPLARVMQEHVKKPISREILFGSLKNGGAVLFAVENDKLVYNVIDTTIQQENLELENNLERNNICQAR